MVLNLNWFKSYDTYEKHAKNSTQITDFFTKSKMKENGNICVLSHNFSEKYKGSWQKNG